MGGLGCPVFARRGPQTLCKRQARGVHVGNVECTLPIGEGDRLTRPVKVAETHSGVTSLPDAIAPTLLTHRVEPLPAVHYLGCFPASWDWTHVISSWITHGLSCTGRVHLTCVSRARTCTHTPRGLRVENGCDKSFLMCLLWER